MLYCGLLLVLQTQEGEARTSWATDLTDILDYLEQHQLQSNICSTFL